MKEGALSVALGNLWAVINQIRIWQCLFLHKFFERMTPYLCLGGAKSPLVQAIE